MLSKISNIKQTWIAIFLSAYVGLLLNYPVYLDRLGQVYQTDLPLWFFLLEPILVFSICFILFRLLSLGGIWFFRIVATIIVVCSVAASYYMVMFKAVIGYGIIASVLTTDIDLSKEVVGYHFFFWLVGLNILPVFLIWQSRLEQGLNVDLFNRQRVFKSLTVLSVFIVVAVGLSITLVSASKRLQRLNNTYVASYGGVLSHMYLPANWLAATGLYAYTNLFEDEDLLNPAHQYSYIAPPWAEDLYVVFVIGETTRWDHLGLFGYERPTTPMLGQESNLLALKGRSCDTATKLSLRCMFVREGGVEDNPQRTLKEENVFAVLHELGFTSELFAMQSEVWFYANTLADNYKFREILVAEPSNIGKPVDDMLLIDTLQTSLQDHPKGKHLVVLHTKGSHYLYSQRYPREYAKYQPECMGVDERCSQKQLINAFDNSIVFTDHFLKRVLDSVRDKNAIVFYASDHGESISNNMHLHGTPRNLAPDEQFRVPILMWASDRFLQNSQLNLAKLREQTTAQHSQLYDSVLGCIGYTSPNGGLNMRNNWCATGYVEVTVNTPTEANVPR